MKKINKFLSVGLLCLAGLLFCGQAKAADSNVITKDYETNWTHGQNYVLFNNYSGWGAGEFFSGSTTANGGTTSVTAGLIDTRHLSGTKYLSIYGVPTTATGSLTVNVYEWFGTNTVTNANGTAGAYLRSTTNISFLNNVGSSTLITITENPVAMAVSVLPSAGSISTRIGLNSLTSR